MAVIVLLGPGGSPGVTAAALALTLAWPRAAVMAECDPAGGSVLAGLWRGYSAAAGRGMLPFALAAQQDPAAAAAAVLDMAEPLSRDPDGPGRWVLPAGPDPVAARQLTTAWPAAAAALGQARADVIADAGRYDGDSDLAPLLAAAARVLMVCRPDVRQAAAARPRLAALARLRPADGLIVTGDGDYAGGGALAEALGIPAAGTLPGDPATAAVLTRGARPRRMFSTSPLMRAAGQLARGLAAEAVPAGQAW